MAKIIVGTTGGAFAEMTKKDAPTVQLRYCFIEADNTQVPFFVSGKVSGVTPYMNSQNLAVVTLAFTQRPPDDLILKLGSLLEATQNSVQRREERIVITQDSLRKLNIEKEESLVFIQNVPRKCILRDLSFSGAKIILLGIVKFLVNKEAILQISFSDTQENVGIKGTVVSAVPIEGRQDIATLSIVFDEKTIPMNYKIHINNYLTNTRKTFLDASAKQMQHTATQPAQSVSQPAAAKPAAAKPEQQAATKPAQPDAQQQQPTSASAPAQKPAAQPEEAPAPKPADEFPPETDVEILEESLGSLGE